MSWIVLYAYLCMSMFSVMPHTHDCAGHFNSFAYLLHLHRTIPENTPLIEPYYDDSQCALCSFLEHAVGCASAQLALILPPPLVTPARTFVICYLPTCISPADLRAPPTLR